MSNLSLLRTYQSLLYCCSPLILLLFCDPLFACLVEEESEIVLPCKPPLTSDKTQSLKRLNSVFFEYADLDPHMLQETVSRDRPDGRRRVVKTDEFPYSAQIYFVVTFPESPLGTCETGSGTFIHPNIILTAGHVVYSHKYGGIYTTIKCCPAQNESTIPFDIPRVTGVKIHNKYWKKEEKKDDYDYALVFIEEPTGEKTGHLGVVNFNEVKLKGLDVTIAGYPADKMKEGAAACPTLWQMSGKPKKIDYEVSNESKTTTLTTLLYDIDTSKGQSGSGIWYKNARGEYYVVGLHAYGASQQVNYNYGPRITEDKAYKLKQWIEKFKKGTLKYDNHKIVALQTEEANKSYLIQHSNTPDIKTLAVFGEKDLPLELLLRAKRENQAKAQYEIGLLYVYGRGVKQDDEEAFSWLRRAAGQKYPEAQITLGMMYNTGKGITKNEEKAFGWLEEAAEGGSKEAQYHLSVLYYDGEGKEDPEKAFYWCEKSANKGYPDAYYRLGGPFREGAK